MEAFVDFECKESYDVGDLLRIMEILRSGEGCPWDRQQTHASIRHNLIEETYEAAEAIDDGDTEALCEELGDVLMQIVFHCQIEKEKGSFGFSEICDGLCKKLIVRHPHVFGDKAAFSAEYAFRRWDEIKAETKGQKTGTDTLMAVPKTLPALMRSAKLQKRAAKASELPQDLNRAFRDLDGGVAGLREAAAGDDVSRQREELGNLLFAAVEVAEALDAEPEECLSGACERFTQRFSFAEEKAAGEGRSLRNLSPAELEKLWDAAKKEEEQKKPRESGNIVTEGNVK
jgi:tetrapyrrole methylase family protein/MazG family protein